MALVLISAFFNGASAQDHEIEKEEKESSEYVKDNIILDNNYRLMTEEDMSRRKGDIGVRQPNINYNQLNGELGTGLSPPTEREWENMVGKVWIRDSSTYDKMLLRGMQPSLPNAYDLSDEPYFPQVRSQGSQGSCAAFAATYYAAGYMHAKANGWTDAESGENDEALLSPAFTYNKVNRGADEGSSMFRNLEIMQNPGVSTWETMPYCEEDHTSWGDEEAWREAPIYRVNDIYSFTIADVFSNYVKEQIVDGHPVIFSLNTSSYGKIYDDNGNGEWNGRGFSNPDDSTLTDILNSTDMNMGTNHAQTIVGYDDNKECPHSGETGAFKVVNSWGLGNFPMYGYYWITYEAMEGGWNTCAMYYFDIVTNEDDDTNIFATWTFETSPPRRDAEITFYPKDWEGNIIEDYKIQPHWDYLNFKSEPTAHPSFMLLDITNILDGFENNHNVYFSIDESDYGDGHLNSLGIELYHPEYIPDEPAETLLNDFGVFGEATPCEVSINITIFYPNVEITSPEFWPYETLVSATVEWIGSDNLVGLSHYELDVHAFNNNHLESVVLDAGYSDYTFILESSIYQSYKVYVKAVNNYDLSTSTHVHFFLDTPPEVDITSPNTGQTFTTTNTVTVEWEGYDDGSGINYYEIRRGIVGDSINIGTDTSYTFENLNDGFHRVYVRAYDQTSYGEDDVFFYVETDPHVEITYPFYGQTLTTNWVYVQWTSNEHSISHFQIRLNGGTWINKGTSTFHMFTNLNDGPQFVVVRVNLNTGGYGEDSVFFHVDTGGGGGWETPLSINNVETDTDTVTAEWIYRGESVVNYYEIRLNDGRWINVGGRSSINLHGLDKGVHRFSVRVVNNDGYIGYDTVIFYMGE